MACEGGLACIGSGGCVEAMTIGAVGTVLTVGADGTPQFLTAADDQTAAEVPYTPGTITGVNNVQDAIDAIDCEYIADCIGAQVAPSAGIEYDDALNVFRIARSADAENFLEQRADGLYVTTDCETVQDCIGDAVAAERGLSYDDVANTFSVAISAIAENRLTQETDGLHVLDVDVAQVTDVFVANAVGAFNFTGASPTQYDAIDQSVVINNIDATRNMRIIFSATGSMFVYGISAASDIDHVLDLLVDGTIVKETYTQNDRAAGSIENGAALTTTHVFSIPPGGSATVRMHLYNNVYVGGFTQHISRVDYAWEGVLS